MGRKQPRLPYSHRSNTIMRVIGVLDAQSGQVQAWHYSRATAKRVGKSWQSAIGAYAQAKRIYLVMDNWPVHFHKDAAGVLAADPRVQILPLPTYSPWLNNIEKLWRWVKNHVTHTHPWCDDFNLFKEHIMSELEHASGLLELRRYCGLDSLFSQ